MQLLSEFIGKQKIRLVGVGVSRLRERDTRQTIITDFALKFPVVGHNACILIRSGIEL